MTQALLSSPNAEVVPRSIGAIRLSSKRDGTRHAIDRLRLSGAMKAAFPRRGDAVEAILMNTSGGLTGGDRFEIAADAGTDSRLVLTTQAAERAYRSMSGTARVSTRLKVGQGAALHWLPQELIVFDGASLERRLDVDLADGAELVLVEAMVFGRAAMSEVLRTGTIRDRITIRRKGVPIWWDAIDLSGDIAMQLSRPAVAGGMAAMATVLHLAAKAEALLPEVRRALPETGGASLIGRDLLCARIVAPDSFLLRRSLVAVLQMLTGGPLPKSWSL